MVCASLSFASLGCVCFGSVSVCICVCGMSVSSVK